LPVLDVHAKDQRRAVCFGCHDGEHIAAQQSNAKDSRQVCC
jgi:hypothetical protein